jgi:hypothetical protein
MGNYEEGVSNYNRSFGRRKIKRMGLVKIININLLNNIAFDINFQVVSFLEHDLDFKVTYEGQLLEHVQVGPLEVGFSRFVLKTPAILKDGITVVVLTVGYNGEDFYKVGYFIVGERMITNGSKIIFINHKN